MEHRAGGQHSNIRQVNETPRINSPAEPVVFPNHRLLIAGLSKPSEDLFFQKKFSSLTEDRVQRGFIRCAAGQQENAAGTGVAPIVQNAGD